jgi:hypothetical protein
MGERLLLAQSGHRIRAAAGIAFGLQMIDLQAARQLKF